MRLMPHILIRLLVIIAGALLLLACLTFALLRA